MAKGIKLMLTINFLLIGFVSFGLIGLQLQIDRLKDRLNKIEKDDENP